MFWITYWNFGSKYVNKAKYDVVFDLVGQKSNDDLDVLQYNLFVFIVL
jgi:hypothetical protein